MKALVIYESMFGNTEKVATAIANGIGSRMAVELHEVADAPATIDPDVSLLVIGGPTHVHGLSRPRTRAGAADQAKGPLISTAIGVREWIESLTVIPGLTRVATFDTRLPQAKWITGSAAKGAARLLRRRQKGTARPPESFFVEGTDGPLRPGELNRAKAWGEALV